MLNFQSESSLTVRVMEDIDSVFVALCSAEIRKCARGVRFRSVEMGAKLGPVLLRTMAHCDNVFRYP